MAYGIYAEDFLAIYLYMVNGDLSVSLSELITAVELFQKKKIIVNLVRTTQTLDLY